MVGKACDEKVFGLRLCLNSLPLRQDLSGGYFSGSPRTGPVTRAGFEPQWQAAGSPFPNGEPETRALYIDGSQMSRKRSAPLDTFDRNGAVGTGPPRTEVRALTIDDPVCRARSEPPRRTPSRVEVERALQAFGAPCNSENIHGRRQARSPEIVETRTDVIRAAAQVSDIQGMCTKKHFHRSLSPESSLSPRLAAARLDAVCIDAHRRRKQIKPTVSSPEKEETPYQLSEKEVHLDGLAALIGRQERTLREGTIPQAVRERERARRSTTSVPAKKLALRAASSGDETPSTRASDLYSTVEFAGSSCGARPCRAMRRVIGSLRSELLEESLITALADVAGSYTEERRSEATVSQQLGHPTKSVVRASEGACGETTPSLADSQEEPMQLDSQLDLKSLSSGAKIWDRLPGG